MLRNLVGTRSGRRIIAVLIIAVLVVSSLAVYLQMSQQKNVKPLTRPGGSGYVSGIPDTVNLTAVHEWTFPLSLVVTESYVSGIVVNITHNSTFSNTIAYFSTTGNNWKEQNGNLTLESNLSYYAAGNTDSSISLVILGNADAAGWIGISVHSVLGSITPSFKEVHVFGYKGGTPLPSVKYIRFGNLPASLTVSSGSSGVYGIHYSSQGTTGGIGWTTNTSWVTAETSDTAHAAASYTAPSVDVNTTYVVNITATSGNGITNSSTLTFLVVAGGQQVSPSISLDNLPATVNVYPGEAGAFVLNYTAIGISGGLSWSANKSWVDVSTVNGTAAYANYTAPVVSTNSSFVVLISVVSGNGASNASTLTFNVLVNQTSPPQASIGFDNLPATITVMSGSKGQYNISYTAIGISGGLSWSSNKSWVDVSTVNGTAAYANYTAPYVDVNTTYVVNITATSGNGITNSSTLTFLVVAGGALVPVATSNITTEIWMNNSELEATINGGVHLNLVLPSGQSNSSVLIYTSIRMNNSELEATINGGVHLNIRSSSQANLTIYVYTAIYINNSGMEVNVNGGIDVNVSSQNVSVTLVQHTLIESVNSSISIDFGHIGTNVNLHMSDNSSIADSQALQYGPFFTEFYLNNSELEIHINGGVRASFYTAEPGYGGVAAVYTYIGLNHSELEIEIDGGVSINLLGFAPGQSVLNTTILLNGTEREIEMGGLRIPSVPGYGSQDTGDQSSTGYAASQVAAAEAGAIVNSPTTMKLASHTGIAPAASSGTGGTAPGEEGFMQIVTLPGTFSGPPQSSGPP